MKALILFMLVLLTGCSNSTEVEGVQKAIDALSKGCNQPISMTVTFGFSGNSVSATCPSLGEDTTVTLKK